MGCVKVVGWMGWMLKGLVGARGLAWVELDRLGGLSWSRPVGTNRNVMDFFAGQDNSNFMFFALGLDPFLYMLLFLLYSLLLACGTSTRVVNKLRPRCAASKTNSTHKKQPAHCGQRGRETHRNGANRTLSDQQCRNAGAALGTSRTKW